MYADVSPQDYMMAYEDSVGPRPGIDSMRDIVCTQKLRPQILPAWSNHTVSPPHLNMYTNCCPFLTIPSSIPFLFFPSSIPSLLRLPFPLTHSLSLSPSPSLPLSLPLPPSLPPSLSLQGLGSLVEAIEDCWDEDPEARLSASNITFRLKELLDGGPPTLTEDHTPFNHVPIRPGNERYRRRGEAQETTTDTIGTTDSRPPPYDSRWSYANAGGGDERVNGGNSLGLIFNETTI